MHWDALLGLHPIGKWRVEEGTNNLPELTKNKYK